MFLFSFRGKHKLCFELSRRSYLSLVNIASTLQSSSGATCDGNSLQVRAIIILFWATPWLTAEKVISPFIIAAEFHISNCYTIEYLGVRNLISE